MIMAKYLKNHDEVLKSIDKIANRLTIKDLIKNYMGDQSWINLIIKLSYMAII